MVLFFHCVMEEATKRAVLFAVGLHSAYHPIAMEFTYLLTSRRGQ